MWRPFILICALVAFAGIIVISLNPVAGRLLKLAFLGCVVGVWMGGLLLAWQRKPLRIVLLLVPVILSIPFLLPGGTTDPAEVRDDYVRRMSDLEGTRYVWGGENPRGIDCSGLPRRAFRDALLAYGIRQADGSALRAFLEQWWFDASARDLGAGRRAYTVPVGIRGTIHEMDYTGLIPGDLAVTTSGIHVLAYAGDGRWIQACPRIGAVATLDGRTGDSGWFSAPVTIHRWRTLARN